MSNRYTKEQLHEMEDYLLLGRLQGLLVAEAIYHSRVAEIAEALPEESQPRDAALSVARNNLLDCRIEVYDIIHLLSGRLKVKPNLNWGDD
jgi:hypothetical protein